MASSLKRPDIDRPGNVSSGSDRYYFVTKANADLPQGVCRAILCGVAGDVNLRRPDGVDVVGVPLFAGYNPLAALRVNLGGSADNIWSLY